MPPIRLPRCPGNVKLSLPIIPPVLLSFNIPNAILGKTHAKYKKKVVDMTLCIVLFPTTPVIRKCSCVTI